MRIGVFMSLILFLAGIWVAIMPEVAGFHPASGNPWTAPSLVAAVLGGGIAVASLVGLVGFFASLLKQKDQQLRELAVAREAEAARAKEAQAGASSGSEPVRALPDREGSIRKLSRVERAQERATMKSDPSDVDDVALKELAQTILKDLQRSPSH